MVRLFRVFIPLSVVALVWSDVALGFLCFISAAYVLIIGDVEIFLLFESGLERIGIVVLSFVLGLYFQDLYSTFRIRSRIMLVQQVLLAIGVLFLVQAALAYISPTVILPRSVMLVGSGLLLLLAPAWRMVFTSQLYKTLGQEKLLFVGMNPLAAETIEKLQRRPEIGLRPIGFLSDGDSGDCGTARVPMLGCIKDVQRIAIEQSVDRIVVALRDRRNRMPSYELLDLKFRGIMIQEAASLFETCFGRVPIRELRPSQLIFSDLGPVRSRLQIQTLYSFVIAAAALVVFAPVMLLVAIAVKLTSRGPILFRQTRVGMNGRHFQVYKFRSMIVDAEASTGAVWASKDDPRITTIGKHLRQLRLDELPQLFNVLRGEMSIVGPRPERPEFVQTLSEQIPFYRQRHFVKPGVTGWAQINHKYGDTIEDTIIKLEFDLYYIKEMSVSLDTYIIFHTLKVMLFSEMGQ